MGHPSCHPREAELAKGQRAAGKERPGCPAHMQILCPFPWFFCPRVQPHLRSPCEDIFMGTALMKGLVIWGRDTVSLLASVSEEEE